MTTQQRQGYFGTYGGRYVPETLVPVLDELTAAYESLRQDEIFLAELRGLLADFVGRPTPLNHAAELSRRMGCDIWLKREDLCHTGAHKINNAIGQGLVAKRWVNSVSSPKPAPVSTAWLPPRPVRC